MVAGGKDPHVCGENVTQAQVESAFQEHRGSLYALALFRVKDETVAEDIVAQVQVRVWKAADSLRSDASPREVKSFLGRCVINLCKDYWALARLDTINLEAVAQAVEAGGMPMPAALTVPSREVELLEQEEQTSRETAVRAALEALPEKLRRAVEEVVLQEATYREAALTLECSHEMVRLRVGQGLALLRLRLHEHRPFP